MKTNLTAFGRNCWQTFTDVPGWPDAPAPVRFRRALPLLIPCVAMLVIVGWNRAVRDPFLKEERAAHQVLVSMEKEIESLRMNCSEQQAGELAARTAQVTQMTLNRPEELGPVLEDLTKRASSLGWTGLFQASDLSTGATAQASSEALVTFVQARAKLTSMPGNPGAFSALLALLEQVSANEKRIDLTRTTIRADDFGRYAVELNLRLMCRHAP